MILVDKIAVLFGFLLALPVLLRGRMISFTDPGEWSMVMLFGWFWLVLFVVLRMLDWICDGPARRARKVNARIID